MPWFYPILFVVFFALALLVKPDNEAWNSAFFGVFLEGAILTGLIGSGVLLVTQSINEKAKNAADAERNYKKQQLESAIALVIDGHLTGNIFHWTRQLDSAPKLSYALARLDEYLQSKGKDYQNRKVNGSKDMEKTFKMKAMREGCSQYLSLFQSMTPIAADVSAKHLKAWLGFVNTASLLADEAVEVEIILNEFVGYARAFLNADSL